MKPTINTYSVLLGERRALINETDAILSVYDEALEKKQLGKLVCTKGVLPDLNWSSTITLVTRFFYKRYMNEYYQYKPASLMKDFGWMGSRHQEMLYFVFTALVEEPLYNFVTKNMYLNHSGMDVIDKADIKSFLEMEISEKGLEYKDSVVYRLSNGLLASLKEFGLLVEDEDLPAKALKVQRPYLTDELLLVLVYFLRKNKGDDYKVIHHRLWALFGLTSQDVVSRLKRRPDMYLYQSSGSLVKLSQVITDDREFINAVKA